MQSDKAVRRHRFFWYLLSPIVRFWLRIKYNYHPYAPRAPRPALIISNHVTDLDPLLLGATVHTHTYFIASDHIFRKKIGQLVLWLQAPITRTKGTTASDTALTALRRLKAGHNVCVFAEGNRTFNGRTGAIVESTAKLAKSAARIAGASLVLFRFDGGYMTSPRWAGSAVHRGRMSGGIRRILSAEELKVMSPEAIADAIREGIFTDAYAAQKANPIPYRSRRRAEHMERALHLCPQCHSGGKLRSAGNFLFCDGCGLRVEVDKLGFFRGNLPFETLLEWDEWQAQELMNSLPEDNNTPLASDTEISLIKIENFEETLLDIGDATIYRDRFVCCGQSFPFADIPSVGLPGPQAIEFETADGKHFTFRSDKVRNLRKYATVFRAVTAPETVLDI